MYEQKHIPMSLIGFTSSTLNSHFSYFTLSSMKINSSSTTLTEVLPEVPAYPLQSLLNQTMSISTGVNTSFPKLVYKINLIQLLCEDKI